MRGKPKTGLKGTLSSSVKSATLLTQNVRRPDSQVKGVATGGEGGYQSGEKKKLKTVLREEGVTKETRLNLYTGLPVGGRVPRRRETSFARLDACPGPAFYPGLLIKTFALKSPAIPKKNGPAKHVRTARQIRTPEKTPDTLRRGGHVCGAGEGLSRGRRFTGAGVRFKVKIFTDETVRQRLTRRHKERKEENTYGIMSELFSSLEKEGTEKDESRVYLVRGNGIQARKTRTEKAGDPLSGS